MAIVILANNELRRELGGDIESESVIWLSNESELAQHTNAEVVIDLLYSSNTERTSLLKTLGGTVVISSPIETLRDFPDNFVRINGWPGFVGKKIIEAATNYDNNKIVVESAFGNFNKAISWTPDFPGFISARVLAMIINEAYLTLSEKVSTKEDIDTAMKLGTNYPYGPFEWSKLVGLKNIRLLLEEMEKENSSYAPAHLLVKETQV